MSRSLPSSPRARLAVDLVSELQLHLVESLVRAASRAGFDETFQPIEWLRDGGRHGGGVRYAAVETPAFNRASVNMSSVHYDDLPDKKLGSANALSTIIHPRHPKAASMHMHISWTEMKAEGGGYWRVMGDLNPSIEHAEATRAFEDAMRSAAPALYDEAAAQGAKYFHIPALERHRGVAHFYLEGYSSSDFDVDRDMARGFGRAVIACYADITEQVWQTAAEPTEEERSKQLAYHTAYLLQVLTLDRGTTSGLLVHDQNDVGILGSLPAFVDRVLLASWVPRLSSPQNQLLAGIVDRLPDEHPCHVTDSVRGELAAWIREHYRAHPNALAMQAAGDVIPPTVDNHIGTTS